MDVIHDMIDQKLLDFEKNILTIRQKHGVMRKNMKTYYSHLNYKTYMETDALSGVEMGMNDLFSCFHITLLV